MTKPKLFPAMKGFNYCLGWAQPEGSTDGYKKYKKNVHHTVDKPIREESHLPTTTQAMMSFDMY